MPYLKWITDDNLIREVRNLMIKAEQALDIDEKKFHKNVIDPFSALLTMAGFDIDYEAWEKVEYSRQAQKTLQNHIGEFHQKILGCVPGWTDLGTGNVVDLLNTRRKILAEIKNKHNTVTGGKLVDDYKALEDIVMNVSSIHHGYTAYFVTIVPKKKERINSKFTPSDKKIRIIDGASFYALVTGRKNALLELFNVLPKVIEENVEPKRKRVEVLHLVIFFSKAFE
jgi:hypothetical protein